MGYEVTRFADDSVDEELICPICSGVLESALQAPDCEHTFCGPCINEWVARQPTCPVDRAHIGHGQLRPAPRIVRNLLARLEIACEHASSGCSTRVKLDQIEVHEAACPHNPSRPVTCTQGCGLSVPHADLPQHSCVKELRGVVVTAEKRQAEITNDLAEVHAEMGALRRRVGEQDRRIDWLMEAMRNQRSGPGDGLPPALPPLSNSGEEAGGGRGEDQGEVGRWARSLSCARVTRWGGMISTPDAVLQAVIRRALSDSGCPAHIVGELMENAHERRWPLGLSTLETRQLNRRQYENYTARRIPGRQAVVVMTCENGHMPDNLIREPGVVMIFAHGVE